ncbi:MAG: hypothetical protein SNJ29_10820 [Rikenellaceae bacterium]
MKLIIRGFATLIAFVSIFVSSGCCSVERKYIKELESFTTHVNADSDSFTESQWDNVLEAYEELRLQREHNDYRFTRSEVTQIDSCYRILNATMAKSFIKINTNKVEGYLNEFKNLLEDITK